MADWCYCAGSSLRTDRSSHLRRILPPNGPYVLTSQHSIAITTVVGVAPWKIPWFLNIKNPVLPKVSISISLLSSSMQERLNLRVHLSPAVRQHVSRPGLAACEELLPTILADDLQRGSPWFRVKWCISKVIYQTLSLKLGFPLNLPLLGIPGPGYSTETPLSGQIRFFKSDSGSLLHLCRSQCGLKAPTERDGGFSISWLWRVALWTCWRRPNTVPQKGDFHFQPLRAGLLYYRVGWALTLRKTSLSQTCRQSCLRSWTTGSQRLSRIGSRMLRSDCRAVFARHQAVDRPCAI